MATDKATAALGSENAKKVPEYLFVMINEQGKAPLIRSLDDYVAKKQDILEIIAQACDKFGKDNVRLCKIIPTEVKVSVNVPSGESW